MCLPCNRRLATTLVAAILGLFASRSALAYSCDIVCGSQNPPQCTCTPGVGVCEIYSVETVPAGAVIDCSGTTIQLMSGYGGIKVSNGFLTLRAQDLIVNANRQVQATAQPTPGIAFGMKIELTGKLDLTGYLNANGDAGGGVISVDADGDILIRAGLNGGYGVMSNGTSSGAPGGSISLISGGSVTISDPVVAKGSTSGVTTGGSIVVDAAGDISIGDLVSVYGHKAGAGTIDFTAGDAAKQTPAPGVTPAPGHIAVEYAVKAEGDGVEADGGEIRFKSNQLTIDALVSAIGGLNVSNETSHGGNVSMNVGSGGLAINNDVQATGGQAGAGDIRAVSSGPITIAGGVHLLAGAVATSGDGGNVILESNGALTVGSATIDATGNAAYGNTGNGGAIELSGCAVSVATGATVDASGYAGGSVLLTGRESLFVSPTPGTVVHATFTGSGQGSGQENGSILLGCRVPSLFCVDPSGSCGAPACTGSTGTCTTDASKSCTTDADCCPSQFSPCPEFQENASLGPCE